MGASASPQNLLKDMRTMKLKLNMPDNKESVVVERGLSSQSTRAHYPSPQAIGTKAFIFEDWQAKGHWIVPTSSSWQDRNENLSWTVNYLQQQGKRTLAPCWLFILFYFILTKGKIWVENVLTPTHMNTLHIPPIGHTKPVVRPSKMAPLCF